MPSEISEDTIIRRLDDALKCSLDNDYASYPLFENPRPAAVLIPLVRNFSSQNQTAEWHILFTRRSDTLEEHRGQVAFPGGRSDGQDSTPEETALREAYEEIGLKANDVRILGKLREIPTISNYCVTPIIGVIPWPYDFRLATQEVSRIFTIPLEWLANPSHYEIRERILPTAIAQSLKLQSLPVIYFTPYDGELLWGISAQIVLSLIEVIFNN